jgi:hypothetical protein
MESEWLRLEHRGTSICNREGMREWYACEVPNEDENSGDDDWIHVADVFIDIKSGIVSRIDIVFTQGVDSIFDPDEKNGNLQRVIIAWLRNLSKTPFADEILVYCTQFRPEEDFCYFRDPNMLVR